MVINISKPKTWKGLSYVLKSSLLINELELNGMDCYVDLNFWTPQQNNRPEWSLIEAEYWLPNSNVDYGRFYIRTGVVPSPDRKVAENIFINEVLLQLVKWMKIQVTIPVNSTNRPGMFYAFYKNGKLFSH